MSGERMDAPRDRGRLQRIALRALAAVALVALGAIGAAAVLQRWAPAPAAPPPSAQAPPAAAPPATVPPPAISAATAPSTEDVEVLLTPEVVTRLKLRTAPVASAASRRTVSVPATVLPNAYREVKVTPIAAGIVTALHAELGSRVARGMPLATIFSAELADAQTKLLSMQAMLDADHRKLERVQELVKIGAASRQELEDVTAVHATHETEVEAARQRLLLLGLTPSQVQALTRPGQIVSTVVVPAPIDGVVTGRSANQGQVVGLGQELFTVTDLSDVWVVGEVYEQDFAAVRIGSAATITSAAYPGLALRGRASYIDPRVDPQARTAKVRVAVPDPGGRLKLGMYVTAELETAAVAARAFVPRAAVQLLGDRHVVFLRVKGVEGKYLQRVVQLGPLEGDRYPVQAGLEPSDEVVTDGSFFLRAESLRNPPGR